MTRDFAEISDWDLMQIHVSALYRQDDRHRLLAVNEPGDPRPDDPPPPRLYLGRTRAGNLWRFRHDLPEALIAELEAVLRGGTGCGRSLPTTAMPPDVTVDAGAGCSAHRDMERTRLAFSRRDPRA